MNGLKKIRKYLFNLFWIALAAMVLLLATGFFLINKYEEEIKDLSITHINQVIETKIFVDRINVTFLNTFPHFSVVFHDVIIESSHNFNKQEFLHIDTDHLFTAEKLYLKFNALDLIRSKIRIRRIYAVNGDVNILIDSEGKTNSRIYKSGLENPNKKNRNNKIFELEMLRISNFNLYFNNLSKKTYSSSRIDNLLLKGKFSREDFSLGTHTSFVLHDFTRNGFRYANEYDISLRLILEVKDSLATIRKGELSLNTINLDTRGNFRLGGKPSLDLMLDSRNINISTLLGSFPEELREKLPFTAQGRGDLAVKIRGPVTSIMVPEIHAVYVLNLSQVQFQKETVRNLRLKGKYTNGERQRPSTTEIDIQKFRVQDRNSDFSGKLNVQNLVNPVISLDLEGGIDAKQLSAVFIRNNDIQISGKLYPDIKLRTAAGSFRDINVENIAAAGISGNMELSEIDLKLPGYRSLTGINGNVGFAGDSWFPEFTFFSDKDEFRINAQLDYVLRHLTDRKQVLWINGIISGDRLDLKQISQDKNDPDEPGNKALLLPANLAGNIDFSFKHLNTGKFAAWDLLGSMVYKQGRIDIPAISFLSMNGKVEGDAALIQNPSGDFYLKSHSFLNKINISELFHSFNNFGQNGLTSDHLSGFISGEVDFNAVFDSTLKIKKDKILAQADIIIRSGQLNDYKPAEKLSGFVGIDELSNIRFSTLENSIFIENNKMTIPEMEINSNAFNIKASGIHNFNGYFDYKMKILLSEILTGKARQGNEGYYVMEDSRRASLYLSITGTAADYNIKYDKQEAISAIKDDLKEEKKNLKAILNEEFGWFGKDSLDTYKNNDSRDFIIEWKSDSLEDNIRSIDRQKKKKKKKSNLRDEEVFELEWKEDDDL